MEKEKTERDLLALGMALGAAEVPVWSQPELNITAGLPEVSSHAPAEIRSQIRNGHDPLGEAFCGLRSADTRRLDGATYTPAAIVRAMVGWARRHPEPARIVDPGAGSGRFIVAAGRAFPSAQLVAVELDPVAAVLCRAHVAASGLASRCHVICGDYRRVTLDPLPPAKRTLFLGNPPYVRHHAIPPKWKDWLTKEARKRGMHPSALAGLHVYFFLATVNLARAGDMACLITSAEWLDVNYGRMVRELLLNGLGGERLVIIEPTADPFPGTQTTAAIACMNIGSAPKSIFVQRVGSAGELGDLSGGCRVRRERFKSEMRWSGLARRIAKSPAGYVELGELCRVHRGQVTGANNVWISGRHAEGLPASVLFPTITKARELYAAGGELRDAAGLRRVIDLPADLDQLATKDRWAVDWFLSVARSMGADQGYIARHRRPWWSVALREAAPILSTYMARRPPAFVLNTAKARHLNISHGLYPREPMGEPVLRNLVDYLNRNVNLAGGRTYAGGLTKFEPREMERLLVPAPEALSTGAWK